MILTELFSSKMLLRESALGAAESLINGMRMQNTNGTQQPPKLIGRTHQNMICDDDMECSDNPFDSYEENSVVIIPITGMMFKYNTIDRQAWRYIVGMDTIADLIDKADESTNIVGIILLVNTPGGSTQSIIRLEDVLRNRKTPCIGLIDGECCSGGIYALSFCDEIYAMNRMCEVGSIGTFATIIDRSKEMEQEGIKVISIYPPESNYKNLAVREALKGKEQRMIDESLTPFAIHFQNIIKANRKKLDLSVEGIIEGKVFYAYDAIENGLIDGLANIDQVIERIKAISDAQKNLYQQLNSY